MNLEINLNLAFQALNRRYIMDHPGEAADQLEQMEIEEVSDLLQTQSNSTVALVLERLSGEFASKILLNFSQQKNQRLLNFLDPDLTVNLLRQLEKDEIESVLSELGPNLRRELYQLMSYPEDSAGQLMDTRIYKFRETMSVRQCLRRIQKLKYKKANNLYLINESNKLISTVAMQELALAEPNQLLKELAQPLKIFVNPTDPRDEIVLKLEEYKLTSIPVVDLNERILGSVRHGALVKAAEEEATVDIQTMFGVSKDERALSDSLFSVKKRLPWLEINLVTAFLAASVVGLFEDLISKFTALAILLPVVAGQSGNAGAQALAVTMRGLALREISSRQWLSVLFKELKVGIVNGAAIALTTSVGVFIWSRSYGLALVIGSSMILAMIAAGLAGASVPIILTRLGQDPATASSIVLTTVTDIAGFFSFLGIATLFSSFL
jgi:magnesium transporter